jgi:hypothetical protein
MNYSFNNENIHRITMEHCGTSYEESSLRGWEKPKLGWE